MLQIPSRTETEALGPEWAGGERGFGAALPLDECQDIDLTGRTRRNLEELNNTLHVYKESNERITNSHE